MGSQSKTSGWTCPHTHQPGAHRSRGTDQWVDNDLPERLLGGKRLQWSLWPHHTWAHTPTPPHTEHPKEQSPSALKSAPFWLKKTTASRNATPTKKRRINFNLLKRATTLQTPASKALSLDTKKLLSQRCQFDGMNYTTTIPKGVCTKTWRIQNTSQNGNPRNPYPVIVGLLRISWLKERKNTLETQLPVCQLNEREFTLERQQQRATVKCTQVNSNNFHATFLRVWLYKSTPKHPNHTEDTKRLGKNMEMYTSHGSELPDSKCAFPIHQK